MIHTSISSNGKPKLNLLSWCRSRSEGGDSTWAAIGLCVTTSPSNWTISERQNFLSSSLKVDSESVRMSDRMEKTTTWKSPDGRFILVSKQTLRPEWIDAAVTPKNPSPPSTPPFIMNLPQQEQEQEQEQDDVAAMEVKDATATVGNEAQQDHPPLTVEGSFTVSCSFAVNMHEYRWGIMRPVEPSQFPESASIALFAKTKFWDKILGVTAADWGNSFHLDPSTEDHCCRGTPPLH